MAGIGTEPCHMHTGVPDTAAFFEAGLLTAVGRFIMDTSINLQLEHQVDYTGTAWALNGSRDGGCKLYVCARVHVHTRICTCMRRSTLVLQSKALGEETSSNPMYTPA